MCKGVICVTEACIPPSRHKSGGRKAAARIGSVAQTFLCAASFSQVSTTVSGFRDIV